MIGTEKEFTAHGIKRRGTVMAYMAPGADQVVFWIRTGDGELHRFVDGPRQVADPLALAQAVLAGRSPRGLGISELMNILAAAVVEGASTDAPQLVDGGAP
ncbi:hypothetical protein [Inquilinus sp. CA228]|uniref:hypothetical protein n=1 Tax=Inquilinus sp. CA228 TaxID=3455609 RepID=UPI003F8D0A86